MALVFVSRSRHDKEIRGVFRQAILNHGFEPDLMELEDLHYELAGPIIRDKITDDCRRSCFTWRESIVCKGVKSSIYSQLDWFRGGSGCKCWKAYNGVRGL